MKLCRVFSSLCLCCVSFSVFLSGQDDPVVPGSQPSGGRLVGQVLDAETGNVVPGVSVLVTDTGMTAVTDVGGRFLLPNVPPGIYKISFLRAGYVFSSVTDVEIVAKELTSLDFPLPPTEVEGELAELEEYFVDAKVLENSRAGLIARRQRAAGVSDAISSDDFSRTGAGDAATAMSKVVGANVVDGKYVVIRGLGDRYSNTLLNGASLPSADPDKKAVQLDIVPTGLLDSIVTTKSFTPDKPGDFTGGSVNVETKSFPEEFTLNFSGSVKWEDGTTGERLQAVPGREMDFFGKTNERLPADFPAVEDVPSRRDPREEENASIRNQVSAVASRNSLFPEAREADPGYGFAVSHGNSIFFNDRKFGYVVSFTRSSDFTLYDDMREQIWTFAEGDEFTRRRGYEKFQSSQEIAWGVLANAAFQITPEHQVSYTYVLNHNGQDEVNFRFDGFDRDRGVEQSELESGTASLVNYDINHIERELNSHQFKGKHVFPWLGGLNMDWNFSTSVSEEDRPANRALIGQTDEDGVIGYLRNQPDQNLPQIAYRNVEEERDLFQVNVGLPINKFFENSKLKAGYLWTRSGRVARQRFFKFYRGRSPIISFEDLDILAEVISLNSDVNRIQTNQPQWEDLSFRDPNNIANYNGDETIQAGYLMADVSLTEKLRMIGGVRYEKTDLGIEALGSLGQLNGLRETSGELIEEDFLPAFHVVYKMGREGKMNIRGSYGRTLARPTYREIAPFRSTDFVTLEVFEGNPLLERTLVDNFDLRWEWFIGPAELVAVTFFHKDMEKPIVPTVRLSNQLFFSWTNADSGRVTGVEFEARKRLGSFTFSGNFAYIDSAIEGESDGVSFASTFEGQPDFILNADVTHDISRWGITANLLFNAVGQQLSLLSTQANPDIFQDTTFSLDFNLSKRFSERVTLKFSARNLLETEKRFFYLDQDQIFKAHTENREFGLSLSYAY